METIFTGAFSDPSASATPWADTERALAEAELYWLTTVRAGGRPHVTPLIGVWLDGTAYFTTGDDEQKARNLAGNQQVALTTGANRWSEGLDVVVEGAAARRTDADELDRVAAAIRDKYGDDWTFTRQGDQLSQGEEIRASLWAVVPGKVLAFAKRPHAQTSYRF